MQPPSCFAEQPASCSPAGEPPLRSSELWDRSCPRGRKGASRRAANQTFNSCEKRADGGRSSGEAGGQTGPARAVKRRCHTSPGEPILLREEREVHWEASQLVPGLASAEVPGEGFAGA